MNNKKNEKIKPQEERRRTIKYSDEDLPYEFENDILRCDSRCNTLPGAMRSSKEINAKSSISLT